MKSSHAKAAQEIRKELKKFGIKARVKSSSASMTSSVDVYLIDQPPHVLDAIKDFSIKYSYESYGYNRAELPQVRFVFINNRYSDEVRQKAWTELRNRLEGMDEFSEDVDRACNNYDAQSQLHRYMTGFQKDFIYSGFMKPRIAA